VGQVFGLDVGLETADDLILAGNVVQLLRPVLLDPDLLFDDKPSWQGFVLRLYQYCCKSSREPKMD
jgi:hypothetical protein